MHLQQQPAELYQEYNTIEYIQQQAKPVMPPAYVFVVDTSVAEDELRACVASLSQALTTLPEYAQVRQCMVTLCWSTVLDRQPSTCGHCQVSIQ